MPGEVATEVRLLRAACAELAACAAERETRYQQWTPTASPGRCPGWPTSAGPR